MELLECILRMALFLRVILKAIKPIDGQDKFSKWDEHILATNWRMGLMVMDIGLMKMAALIKIIKDGFMSIRCQPSLDMMTKTFHILNLIFL